MPSAVIFNRLAGDLATRASATNDPSERARLAALAAVAQAQAVEVAMARKIPIAVRTKRT